MPNTEQSIEQTGGVPVVELEAEVFGMVAYPTDKTLSVSDMPADAKATGDAINSVSGDIADILLDVAELKAETGSDIPVNNAAGAPSIAEAIAAVAGSLWPVGSVYMTTEDSLPESISDIGTWVEIAIPLKHGDKLYGTRNYVEVDEEFEAGGLHFWLRTE